MGRAIELRESEVVTARHRDDGAVEWIDRDQRTFDIGILAIVGIARLGHLSELEAAVGDTPEAHDIPGAEHVTDDIGVGALTIVVDIRACPANGFEPDRHAPVGEMVAADRHAPGALQKDIGGIVLDREHDGGFGAVAVGIVAEQSPEHLGRIRIELGRIDGRRIVTEADGRQIDAADRAAVAVLAIVVFER